MSRRNGEEFRELSVAVSGSGEVSALLLRPASAHAVFVFGHGAGAGMRHPFMDSLSRALASAGVATFRYQFPYMERGRSIPDRPGVLTQTVQSAIRAAIEHAPDLPLVAGGKSMGGRMTSLAVSEQRPAELRGLAFVGFPLHAPNKPGTERARHLSSVGLPMLFLQGTRDPFAKLELLRPICAGLKPAATLHIVEGADHSFHLLKSAGKTDAEALTELAQTVSAWTKRL